MLPRQFVRPQRVAAAAGAPRRQLQGGAIAGAARLRSLLPPAVTPQRAARALTTTAASPSTSTLAAATAAASPAAVATGAALPPPVTHPAFDVVSHEAVREHSAVATLYRHRATGAELLSVACDEEEKVFGVAFRTPHAGDTGVAHVLEHSVLCGSRKYPVKEPFVQLLKSSLQTYLNAMTYPDRTVYPVASPNTKDFYHLVDVYLDAVFHPRLQPWVLQQEGWHLEVAEGGGGNGSAAGGAPPADGAGPVALQYKGVVYNEMKGVYSSPDSAHAYAADEAMWPDTVYGRSSGGDPLAIPQLTWEAFTGFHARFYHPSNARAFFFGDDDVATRLAIIDGYFSGFPAQQRDELAAAAAVPPQRLFTAPIRVSRPYPVAADGEDAAYDDEGGEGEFDEEGEEGAATVEGEPAAASVADAHPAATIPHGMAPGAGAAGSAVGAAPEAVAGTPHSAVPADEAVAAAATAPASAAAGVPDKHEFTLNWVLHEAPVYDPVTGASNAVAVGAAADADGGASARAGPPDEVTRYGLAVLNHLLMRQQTSTLRKALTDSGLGSAVIGGGLDDGLQQATFSVGLKGVKAADVGAVEALILDTLRKASVDGFDADHVVSSFNTIEFALREFATGGGPRGLSLMLAALPAWIYGRDPIGELRFEVPLAALRAAVAADPRYFQRLIRAYLLDNPHRVGVHMYPDPAYNTRREAAEAEALRAIAAGMSPAQVEAVRADAAALLARQGTPDPPEAVATIPTLSVGDLPRAVKRIPKAVGVLDVTAQAAAAAASSSASASAGTDAPWRVGLPPAGHPAHGSVRQHASRFLWAPSSAATTAASAPVTIKSSSSTPASPLPEYLQHEQPTNGVGYASLYFDVSALQPRLLPLVPLFAWALTSCGTAARDEVRLSHAIGMHTGGLGASTSVMEVPGSRASALPLLVVSGKALASKADRLGELLLEVLASGRLDVRDRVLAHVREAVAGHEAALVSSGGRYASSLLSAQFTKGGWVGEVWGGLTSLAAARTLAHRITTGADGGFDGLAADLEAIRSALLSSSNVLVSAIGDAPSLAALDGALKGLVGGLPAAGTGEGLLRGDGAAATPRRADGWAWQSVDDATTAPWAPPVADVPAHERALPLWPFAPGVIAGNGSDGAAAPPPSRVALVVPTQVNYVIKAGPGYVGGDAGAAARGGPVPGSAEVLAGFLRTGYLWEKVRVQGGAYGGGASLSRHSGMLGFSSYRDPNLGATLGVYDGTAAYLRGLSAAAVATPAALAGELDKAVISTVGALDAPMAPAERGDVSTARHLIGITGEQLQARRDEILGTRPADLEHFAAAAQRVAEHGRVAVVTSEAALKAHTGEGFTVLNPLQGRGGGALGGH